MDKHPNINTTIRLPRQVHGGFPLLLSTKLANLVIAAIEGVLNLKINVPTTDGTNILQTLQALVVQGDLGMEVTMPPQSTGAGGSTTSATAQQMQIINDLGDYYSCLLVTGGVAGGNPVQVLKDYKLRTSLVSEVIQNINHQYSYSVFFTDSNHVTTYQRTDTFSGTSVPQQVIPDALLNDEIWALSCNLTWNGNAYVWIDLNKSGRNWTEVPVVQPV